MADITRWDPFAEMATLRSAIDRMFEDRPFRAFLGNSGTGMSETVYFPVDVFETNDELVLKASLPGIRPEDIEISVHGDVLSIKGETKEETEEKAENWYRRERRYGTVMRQLSLPTEVDADKAQANFENGVLWLTLPKAETAKPKQIRVGGGGQPVIEGQKS